MCADECDLEGKGFVDLGSGVGHVYKCNDVSMLPFNDNSYFQVCMLMAALSNASRFTSFFAYSARK